MAATQERLDRHQALLLDLERYHAEYCATNTIELSDPVRLQDYRLFMDRLEHAIQKQRSLIASLAVELNQDHARWTDRRSKRKALDKATDRFARDERLAQECSEQQQIEEIAALLRSRE